MWLLKEPLGNKTEDLSLLGSCSFRLCSFRFCSFSLPSWVWQSGLFGALGCFLGLFVTLLGALRHLLGALRQPSWALSSSSLGLFVVFLAALRRVFLGLLGWFLSGGLLCRCALGLLGSSGFLGFRSRFLLGLGLLLADLEGAGGAGPFDLQQGALVTRLLMASLTRELFFSTS